MAFNSLSDRMGMAVRRITGRGKLNEADIDEMMKEVRLSLLEADVNYKVVKEFTKEVKELAKGEKILKGLNPGQQVVKVVNDQLKKLMGDEAVPCTLKEDGITVFMVCGLQGAGKTTSIGKLATYFRKKEKKKPFLIAADIYRPAAIDQLQTIGKQINVPVFEMGTKEKATKIVSEGLKEAKNQGCDLVIIDTAGRLHIDDELMQELVRVKEVAKPDEILLTVDAMTGQDAVNVAKSFHDLLDNTGVILTKLDGDTRGGAALSIRKVADIPIKFMGMGEKLGELEVFHPERIASRILGMGDVMSLVEKVTDNIDEDEAMGMMEKLMSGKFNYNDLLKQLKMIKKLGSFGKILGMIPGMGNLKQMKNQIDDKQLVYIECMISSMTNAERKDPKLIEKDATRRERIARGSGRSVQEVNKLRQQLKQQKEMMKRMSNMSPSQMKKMQSQMETGQMPDMSSFAGPTQSKGKGKGKGGFRF